MTEPKAGAIPQSNALREASPDSLSELLSKDPFEFQKQDRGRIVAALREQRAKWEKAEAQGTRPKALKTSSKSLDAPGSPEDLGL